VKDAAVARRFALACAAYSSALEGSQDLGNGMVDRAFPHLFKYDNYFVIATAVPYDEFTKKF
jgi:hypothetical protein